MASIPTQSIVAASIPPMSCISPQPTHAASWAACTACPGMSGATWCAPNPTSNAMRMTLRDMNFL